MNQRLLIQFLVRAKKNTWANKYAEKKLLEDGTKELIFTKNDFKYRDRYFGDTAFIGEEIVWKDDKAIWGMNYYGGIINNEVEHKKVYEFLKLILKNVSNEKPFRGPEKFEYEKWMYLNKVNGEMSVYNGEEKIYFQGTLVYAAHYHGGLIK